MKLNLIKLICSCSRKHVASRELKIRSTTNFVYSKRLTTQSIIFLKEIVCTIETMSSVSIEGVLISWMYPFCVERRVIFPWNSRNTYIERICILDLLTLSNIVGTYPVKNIEEYFENGMILVAFYYIFIHMHL